jgi:hypothetical protein
MTTPPPFADDRRDAIKKELAKLRATDFIREIFHPEWVTNPVLVRKKNTNEWRMCVDYTNLNKHYPKDPFGLPRIDQVIEEDQEKTAFTTPFGAYYYMTMSFGLKNAGATYQ